MRRLLIALGLLLLWAAPLSAQALQPGLQTINALDECATWDVPTNVPSATLQITGTFSGTVTFRASADSLTYFDLIATKGSTGASATTTTTTGQYSVANTGIVKLRACMTSYSSGGANISATRGGSQSGAFRLFDLSNVTGTLAAVNGGTGISSYAIGDLLYANTTTTLAKLADVATGSVLVSGGVGVAPAWSAAPTVTSLTAAAAGFFAFTGRSQIQSGADGGLTFLNAAGTGFTSINLGGTTSSFPRIDRSSADVLINLADGSGRAGLGAGNVTSGVTGSGKLLTQWGTSVFINGGAAVVGDPVGSGGMSAVFGGDSNAISLSNNANKSARLGFAGYTTTTPVSALNGFMTSAANDIYLGGGTSLGYAATSVQTWTAPTATTTTGNPRELINGIPKTLTESSATDVVRLVGTAGSSTGGRVCWAVKADDATDFQSRTGCTYFSAVNKGGSITCTVGDVGTPVVAVSTGTLTVASSCDNTPTNGIDIQLNAASSLTQTTLAATYTVYQDGAWTITPQ